MPAYTSVHIIFNPNSTGRAREQAAELRDSLRTTRPDLAVELVPTDHAGHAVELAYDIATAHRSVLIVSSSGDGGYNEVVSGAMRAQSEGAHPVCAVLPAGNANDHARTMQDMPLADRIAAGAVTQLDLLQLTTKAPDGTLSTRYAHSYIGLGLTPTVAVELNKHSLNSLREAWIVIRTFWGLRPVVIEHAGRVVHLDSLVCSTIPEMAKLLTLSGTSSPDDGAYELTIFRHHTRLRLLLRLIRGVFGDLDASSRTDPYDCTLLRPAPIQLDGEVMQLKRGTAITVAICPKLLTTIV